MGAPARPDSPDSPEGNATQGAGRAGAFPVPSVAPVREGEPPLAVPAAPPLPGLHKTPFFDAQRARGPRPHVGERGFCAFFPQGLTLFVCCPGEGKPLSAAVDARSFLRRNGHGLRRHPVAASARGPSLSGRKGVPVVLPPRAPHPFPSALLSGEESGMRGDPAAKRFFRSPWAGREDLLHKRRALFPAGAARAFRGGRTA